MSIKFLKTSGLYILSGSLFLQAGCQQQQTSDSASKGESAEVTSEEKQVAGDDEAQVAALKEVASNVQTDSAGYVTLVDFRKTEIDNATLEKLVGLSRLQSLLLAETGISDEGLKTVGQLSSLRNLDLRDCPVSNDGLAHLSGLKELKALRLSGKTGATTVDDDGLAMVNSLTGLKVLLLDFLWVSGEGLAKLEALGELEELYLAGTLVGDEDLSQLKLFPKLKKLRLSKLSQVSRPGLEEVAKLKQLQDLDLSENSSLFDDDLAPLASLTTIKRLNLWRVAMTDAGAEHLKGLTNLEWLNLDNTQLTDAGLPALKEMKKLTFLHLGSTAISDAGLPALEGLTALEDLKVTRTAVTEAGVAELKKKLPQTEIQLKYLGSE